MDFIFIHRVPWVVVSVFNPPTADFWKQIYVFAFDIIRPHFDGLVQKRRNPTANALKLRLSGTNPSICNIITMTS